MGGLFAKMSFNFVKVYYKKRGIQEVSRGYTYAIIPCLKVYMGNIPGGHHRKNVDDSTLINSATPNLTSKT